jgi:hypothetical protein
MRNILSISDLRVIDIVDIQVSFATAARARRRGVIK